MKRAVFLPILVILTVLVFIAPASAQEKMVVGWIEKVRIYPGILIISKANPSLKEIAQAYHGKEERLLSYLKGEAAPIIQPEKARIMKRALEKTKALSDADRKALADFIMSHE